MVNYKKKTAKKGRTTSNPTQTEKRTTVPSTLPSPVSDHEQVPVVTSLPPAVDGHLRCFLRVSVPTIHWTVHKYPSDVQVRLKWWGEEGEGVLFRPIDDKATDQRRDSAPLTCVRYAVCSGPRQFNAYLKDMGPLIFDVVHGPSLVGQVRMADATQLSASDPIQGFFDVMSTTSPNEKLALLYITVRFESISAAYNQLSSSIPTVDTEMDSQRRRASDESDVQPTPPPLSLNPATPITHPRHASQDTDPFVSPAPQIKGVKFSSDSPERLEYTAEHTLIPAQATEETEIDTRGKDDTGSMPKSELLSASSLLQTHRGAGVPSDLIGALLQRGEKLREAMVMSADEDNDLDETGGLGSVVERNTPPGKLFKAILTSRETDDRPAVPGEDESSLIESVFLHNNKAVDLVLGEENMHYMIQSPESSPESSIVSELGDPLHDESLLTDLFYTTPAMQSDTDSDHTVSTDDNDDDEQTKTHACTSQGKKISRKAEQKHYSPQTIHSKDPLKMNRVSSSVGYIDPKQSSTDDTADADHTGQQSPNKTSVDSLPSTRNSKESSPNPLEFIENLGPEKLTALGRVDAARVMVDSLGINVENIKPGTYFVEYSFPTSTPAQSQEENISMATELTRIASKKLQDGVVLFNHRSMFPALFNSTVIDYWWRRPLTFRLYFRESGQRVPAVVGVATFPLKTVLQSDTLTSSASLQIKHSRHDESSSSSSVHHISASDDRQCAIGSYGPLLVKVELMTDGKQLHVKSSRHSKPPLPTTTTKTTDCIQVAKPAQLVGQVFSGASHGTTTAVSLSDKLSSRITHKFDVTSVHDHDRDPFTLYMLLWIPDGKDLIQHGYRGNKGLVTKNNLYLVCRMFWCDEVSKSKVCWGSTDPPFGFKQVAPVLLTSSLLQRVCNNFMVIEVWNRVGSHDHGDQLVGLVKLPLHQLYLSYRDPKITETLLKSKFPVVAVDEWCTVTNPFTHIQHGHLRVLLAMGLEEQIAAMLTMKCGGDVPVGMESRPDHHLDTYSVRNKGDSDNVHLTRNQEFVEHQFEITVEDIRGLSVFRSTVWGETDCFVQYHFPYQRHLQSSDSTSEAIPNLQPYRTPTTLCVPDPAFHDVARHTFKLPQGFPVQKHLLAAFTGSWVAAPSVPGSGGVPFQLWRRYYYPNIRDQMVAKASLPLAKLCAMVTMQKQGEANIQTFSLPLTVLAGDEINSMRQDRVHDTGLLDVTVKYQQVRPTQLAGGHTAQKEEDNHVCLSLEVIQACGLKAAASLHAKSNPSLSYPAEVGVNTYIVIQFPLGRKRKHVTRTVPRTFSPEFSYNADILLPVVVPSDVGQKRHLSLAEQLEDSEMLFEVWHQMSRGMSSNLVITSGSQARAAREKDVLLGVGRVPLIKLLTHKTGVKGWYPIYLPNESNIRDASSCDDTEKVIGGLEISISFSEAEDRDHIIHLSRGVGWSLPPGMDCDDDWLDKEELSKERHWEFYLKINKAWIPPSELHSFNSAAKKADKSVKAYARYKLYNKAPICSRISPVNDSGDGKLVCELKHSKDIMLPVTPSLAWHMKEECLEIQLWLSNRRHNADSNSRKRDRLLGSAFVDVSSLLVSQQRKNRQISGLYPLFRSGASDLLGACIHVQVSLNWCSEGGSDPEPDLEQHVSSDDSVYVGSPVEDHDTHSSTMISSQEHSAKTTQHYAKRQLPITDLDSDDTFTAHVIIDQALHLPTVPGNNGERLMPSVYVSYQTLPSVPLSCTSVVVSSTHPSWEFQKLERISYTSLKSQGLVFKVCHTSGGTLDKGAHTQEPGSAEGKQDSSSGDRVIGFVSFDLSPLLAGMRQLIGWYNVTDFNGDCKGQIKLGVSPVIPVSPPRSLPSSSNLHVRSKQDGALVDSPFPVNHGEPCQMIRQDGSDLRSHTDDMSRHPKGLQEDHRIAFRSHARVGVTLDTDGVAETPVCSTSLLFSQLRHNMKELDTLQQNLNLKLRSGNAWNDAVQEDSSVDNPPSSSFPDRGVIATSSKTLETLRAKNTGAQGPDLGSRLSRTEFGEMDFRHEVVSLDGKKISVPDDGQLLSSPHHARDLESHDQNVERTSVATKDEEVEATNGKDIFAFDKGEVEHLQKNAEVGSFLGLQGNMSSKGATNARDIFPFDKEEQEYLQPNTEVDSFFSLGTNRSSAEDRRPSVDSELSVSDISEDLSVSGYVQDNSKTARFTDIKDSWLSSEEEEGTTANVDQSDKPGSSSFPSAFNYAEVGALNNATESQFRCREIDIHCSDHDDGGSGDGNGDKVKVLDNLVAGSKAHEENSLEGISDEVNAGSEKEAGLVNDESDGKVKSFQTDQDNEYNSYASYNKTQSRELPRQAPLSGFHDSFQLTSTALPNFFMPTEQLAESMRALRLGTSLHKANSSYSKLLARSNHLKSDPQTKGKLSERFAKREPVYKARKDQRPPISNAEADRIARIFNSGSV